MSSAGRPKRLDGGERLREWCNSLLDWLGARTTIRAGEGLTVTQTEAGTTIGLLRQPIRRYPAKIATSLGEGAAALPSLAVYTAKALPPYFDTIAIATPRVPDYGRPVKGDAVKVWPWPVGTPCDIVVRPDPEKPGATLVELEVPPERINFGPCAPPAQAAASSPPPPPIAAAPTARGIDANWPDSLLRGAP